MAWQKGQSGNPKGRPRGSKQKLSERFLRDLHKHWKIHGADAIGAMHESSPIEYVKLVASLVPKEDYVSAKVSHQHTTHTEDSDIFTTWLEGVLREEKTEPPEETGTKSVSDSEDAPVH